MRMVGQNGQAEEATMGVPGPILVVARLLFLPLAYVAKADKSANNPTLTRLYGIYTACVESLFFQSGSPMWFAMLFAGFGLRLQARAHVVVSAIASKPRTAVAYA
ncbi:hypothetical protein C5748_06870 [Phyllobacterium phragmitis]|uniref:Uncharacterized protein n=1 Tax=Phyllobacterium phragmitis TaxID=2670329 RepID=A0A2S9IUX8_9HYPH|nr:hypothetical protein [Phyllobacterium phragmitis]PRD44305.1 hypothetical protein C5748_06870 [Phyllobacterium phragmitis]